MVRKEYLPLNFSVDRCGTGGASFQTLGQSWQRLPTPIIVCCGLQLPFACSSVPSSRAAEPHP